MFYCMAQVKTLQLSATVCLSYCTVRAAMVGPRKVAGLNTDKVPVPNSANNPLAGVHCRVAVKAW